MIYGRTKFVILLKEKTKLFTILLVSETIEVKKEEKTLRDIKRSEYGQAWKVKSDLGISQSLLKTGTTKFYSFLTLRS